MHARAEFRAPNQVGSFALRCHGVPGMDIAFKGAQMGGLPLFKEARRGLAA
jgi:hypothetical protein